MITKNITPPFSHDHVDMCLVQVRCRDWTAASEMGVIRAVIRYNAKTEKKHTRRNGTRI